MFAGASITKFLSDFFQPRLLASPHLGEIYSEAEIGLAPLTANGEKVANANLGVHSSRWVIIRGIEMKIRLQNSSGLSLTTNFLAPLGLITGRMFFLFLDFVVIRLKKKKISTKQLPTSYL